MGKLRSCDVPVTCSYLKSSGSEKCYQYRVDVYAKNVRFEMRVSAKQRGELVKWYYTNGCNAAKALRVYQRSHNLRRGPCSVQALRALVRKFEETGCTCDRPRPGRPAVPVETVAEVHQTMNADATARGVSRILDIPKSTVLKILRSVLHMFPYRFHRVQMLHDGDAQQRLDFANEFLVRYDSDNSWPLRILWTDEAHFTLTGKVNSRNCVHWADHNPRDLVPVPLQEAKVTVWCGITSTFVLGPYFFERVTANGFQTCTVTGARYAAMLTDYVIPQLQQRNALANVIWMQDGAPPHVATCVKRSLEQHFADRIISRHFACPWPPRSPDLTPMDFWLWGYLKSQVYKENPKTLSALKDAITREIVRIPSHMLHAAVMSTITRMQSVIVCDGAHIEHL